MKATDTGYGLPFGRALGMLFPENRRLYFDPISERFLTGWRRLLLRLLRLPLGLKCLMAIYEGLYPGMLGYFFCRFCYYDDVIVECLAKNEVDTMVNLGAGMDPRAYHIPGIDKVRCFEVDHPDVVKRKMEAVRRALGDLPAHVAYVGVDLDAQDVEAELIKSGYDKASRILFIWESVSAYLTSDANDAILKFVGRAPRGSKLAFSYASKSFLTGEGLDNRVLKKGLGRHDEEVRDGYPWLRSKNHRRSHREVRTGGARPYWSRRTQATLPDSGENGARRTGS